VGGVVICTSAGCTPTGGAGVTLQGSTPGTQQTGNFNISGTGIASVLQTATLDTASAVALNIGTTNATGINLNQNTTLASTKTLTIQGVATFQNASNSTSAFKINDASGSGVLTVNTSNQYVGIDVATALAPLDVGLSNGGPYSNDFETGALAPLTTTGGWTVNNTAAHSGGYSAASGLNGANFSPYTEMSLVKTLSLIRHGLVLAIHFVILSRSHDSILTVCSRNYITVAAARLLSRHRLQCLRACILLLGALTMATAVALKQMLCELMTFLSRTSLAPP